MNKRIISMLLVLVMLLSSISISEETVTVPGAEPVGEETVIVNENETEPAAEAESETPDAPAQEEGSGDTAQAVADESVNAIPEGEEAESGADTSEAEAPAAEPEEEIPEENTPSEEITEEPEGAEADESADEEPAENAEADPSVEEAELSEQEEPSVPEAEEELTEEADASCSGDLSFTSGWVKLPYGTNLYETQATHETFAYTAKAGIAYAIDRVNAGVDGDRMKVVYAGENGISTVYVKSSAVYPMSADEIAEYTEELENTEQTVYSYVGDVSVSLLAIPVTYWNTEETENTEENENPEIVEPTEEIETEPVEPTEEVESEITESTEEVEPETTEPTEEVEPEITEPTEEVESEITEPTEEVEPEITEPTEEVEPEITEPDAQDEPVTIEPAEKVEPETIEPAEEDEPEISELTKEDEPAVNNDPVRTMVLTLMSAPGPVYNPGAVKFDYPQLTMSVKDSVDLAYTVTGAPASCVGFVVSDESVASVSANGTVTAKAAGIAVVTLVAPNGLTDSLAISVLAAPTDIMVNVDEVTVDENGYTIVTTSFTGDVYGEVYLKDNSDSTIAEAEYIGNGSFRIHGLLSGETTLTFAVDNKDNGNTYTASTDVTVNPAVVRIEVTDPRATLGYNEKVYLMPVAYDGRGNVVETAFTYATSNKNKVAVVGEQIQAKSTSGTADITITAENGVSTVFNVKCVNAPGSVALPAKTAKLAVGESVKLTATLPSGSDSAITWASNNENIVTVSDDGTVTAVSAGKAQIRASAFNGKYALCEFTVVGAPTGITFSEKSYTMKEGETLPTVILFTPDNAGGQVVYSVENTDIAAVSADGVITALTNGTTRLHAVVHNFVDGMDYEAYADLTVKPNVSEIRLATERTTLGVGETLSLAPVAYDRYGNVVETTFTYKASSTYYTKLVAPDAIKGGSTGTSTITITAANGVSIATAFKVMKAPTSIALNATSAKLVTGETLDLTYTLSSGADSAIIWDAQPAGVVTVDENGHVEAIGSGNAVVSCTTFNGKKATCSVNVTESPSEISFKYNEYEVAEGDIIMPEMVMDIPATNAPIVFSISYTDEMPIASVSGNSVKGGYSGYATLTATVHNVKENRDLSAETTIKVVPGVCSIAFLNNREKIGYKETLDPMPRAYDARGNEIAASFTYKSSSTSIKVVEGGLYGNSSYGSANVTVTAANGVNAVKKFTLASAPSTVKLDSTSATLIMSQSVQLTATTNFSEALDITWVSSNENVVKVADGLVTTMGPGTATVTASAYNGKSAACKVTVYSIIEDIDVGEGVFTVKEGAVITPDIMLVPATSFGTITLSVEDSDDDYEIAAVSGSSVKGLISGTATVTATVHEAISDTDISKTFTVNVEPAPCTVEAEAEIVIGYNEIADVTATAYDGRGNVVDTEFTLKPASTYYVKVNGNQIKGSATGTTKLTISAENGVNTVISVKVISAPGSITLNAAALNLQIGESAELIPTLPKNTHASITYASSDETVAIVDVNGVVTGKGMGEATITATTHNGKKATCKVTVGPAPEELAIENVTVKEGATIIPAVILLPEGSMGKVALTAAGGENNEFVAIEGSTIKGLTAGSTTVTATVYDVVRGVNVSKTFDVTVEPAPCTIAVEESVIIGYGEIIDLAPVAYDAKGNAVETVFTLKPSSTYYIKVNGTEIKSTATGKATVTVTAENGVSAVVSVQIVSAPGSITLSPSPMNVQLGESIALEPTLPKNTHASITYASSDENVAVVDGNGVVTGKGMGEATITATTHNGKKATVKVKVGPAPEALAVAGESVTVKEGASVTPTIMLLPEGSMGKVTLTAAGGENNEFVAIEGSAIKGLTAGSTTVTATVYDVMGGVNVSKTFDVTVEPAPCTIEVEESVIIGYGEIIDLAPVAYDAKGNVVETVFTLKPSSTYYIKVNGTEIKSTATGKATVTVTAENGVSAVVSVQIVSAPGSITLSPSPMNVQLGESIALEPTLPKNTHASITYASSDETVAIVDGNGVVTGKGMGEATITATTHNGKKATVKVKVGPAPEALAVAGESVTVKEGASVTPTIILLPEGSMGKVTLTAEGSEENVFIAIEGNVIKGLTAGSTTVTATVYDVMGGVNVSKTFDVIVEPAPYTIAVEENVVIGYGEIIDLLPVAYDTKGNPVETVFTLKPASTYTVKVNGTQVKGSATGSTKVTVTAENGVNAVVNVKVISAPGSITLNPTSMNVQLGEGIGLTPTLPNNTHASITYTSSNDAVAVVDENGVVTGTGMGEATITATTHNGKKATCKVKVGPAPEQLVIEGESVIVKEGMTVIPGIVLLPEGSMGKVTLNAEGGEENEFIAIEGNVIKGLAVGSTTVTATVYDVMRGVDVTKTFTVNVKHAPYTIELAEDIVIGYGEIVDIEPVAYDVNGDVVEDAAFTLKSSSTYYIKVNGMQLKGTASGSCKLTVTAENGVNIVVPIKVCSAPGSVTLNTKAMTLQNGTSAVLTATLPKNTAGAVAFVSSDETIAAVSADGTVTAVGEGSAVITATTFNGKKATCTVTIMAKAESIAFERETVYIAPGSTAALKVNTLPAGSYTAISYESSNPAVVSVDAEGNIKAISAGEVTITARGFSSRSMSEITAVASVKVKGDIAYIDPGCEDNLIMGYGETMYLNPVAYDAEGNIIESDYTYTTANRNRVSVTGDMLKAAGTGNGCAITVKASNGVSKVINIDVVSAPSKVTIPTTLKLSVNETGIIPVTLPDKSHATFTFTSSDNSVLTIDEGGSYKAVSTGTAKVTVKTHNGKTATCTVTVLGAPESIAFNDEAIMVKEGQNVPALITFAPADSWSKLSYTLSGTEDELVTVDENGILTGKLSGSDILRASAVNFVTGETITCSVPVTVVPAPTTIEFRGERIGNAGIGEIIDLKPVALDARGNEVDTVFTLKSASGYAGVVSGTTTVKLNSYGTAKITATADNGVNAVVSFKISYAPAAIKLDVSSCVVPLNGSVKLTSTANNTPECDRTWESSDESIATVTEDGLVQAQSIGTAIITVKTYNNKTAKCTVNVLPEAEDISFIHDEVIVGEGGTLTESAVLPEGTAARIVYASRNPFVATVDPATGLVTGIKAGITSVTATIKNVTTGKHYTATYTLVVKPAPATIELLEERRTIGAGETLELKAVAYDASGEVTSGGFTYVTSSKNYLSLPQEGFIKGGYTGTAKITVTAYNGVSDVFTFKIVSAPSSIKLNTNAVTMSEADTYQLSYKLNSTTTTGAVTYASDNESVVTVDENGLVTAHGAGTATVTVRTYNGKTNTCKFTILYEPDGISLSRNMLTLGETATYALTCGFSEGHMGSVVYESRYPEIASVDENGVVTANVQGETTITVTTVNRITGVSYSDTCLVTVTPQPVKIVILNERDAIGYNETMTLDIVSYDASGNLLDGQFTISSSNSNYIKVSGNDIKGVRTGSATVKIVAYNGLTYTKLIKVTSAPSSVKLNAASAKVVIGAIGFDAAATLNSTSVASAITWESEDPAIAVVDENGHISGVSAGATRVKASSYNGKYAIMTVEVYNQPESVTFESEALSIGIGDSATPAYTFNEGAYSTVTFSCPENNIATVNENGTITAKATGTAHVTVSTVNGKTDTVTVNVVAAPNTVSFCETDITIGVGQKVDVADLVVLPEGTASSLKFAVESSSILTLNGSTITGKNKGTTRVKVTTYNGKTALLTVNVKYAPSSIKVALVNKVLYEGDIPEFAITLTSGSAASYSFESSDPAVLSFDNNGIGHANSMGTAKVKVTTHNNVSATISVTVYKHVSGVSFNEESVSLVHYDAQPLRFTVTPEVAYDTTVAFTSSDPDYVSVNGSGIIEAKQVTTEPVIITVTTNDLGFTDTIAVTVTPVRVTGIELSTEEVTLERNREVTIGATILPANADDKLIEWTSSNNSVATVDFNGKVTATGDNGTAIITATTHDGSFVKTVTVTATKVHLKGAAAQYATYDIEHYATEQLNCIITPEDADIASAVWTSSDESVLTVDQSGRIYGVEEGKANVTCVITDTFGESFTCITAVTVTPVHVTSVELSEQEMTLRVGRGKQVDLTVYPFNADDKSVTWSVDTQDRVTITENEDGAFVIAGQTAGDVTLTVTSNDGAKTDTCLIHVLDALAVVPSSELPKTTTGNGIVFYIDVMNAIGNVSWNISVKKDGSVISTYTAYDGVNDIAIANTQEGTYTVEATVTDSENDTAIGSYSVEVSDRIEYTVDGLVYSYIIAETSSGDVGAFIKLESCPAGTKSITVPASMNDAPVVRIDNEAFMGLTSLVSVAIPASCTEIGARAFKGCTSLTGITNY